VKNQSKRIASSWQVHAREDWPLILGISTAAASVGALLIVVPAGRDLVLGLVAMAMLVLLGLERARARRRMARLAAQLQSVASLEKLEVTDDSATSELDHALNDAIQRTREHARMAQYARQAVPSDDALRMFEASSEVPRSVAILALGLREHDQPAISAETMVQLRQIAGTVVSVAERRSALLQMQGSGTFALIFAAFSQEPAARSAKAAYDAAVELAAIYPQLHFGLSSGTGVPCSLPGAGYTVIGSPLEEAIRLHRLAASWHEYRLLCPEPVALLLRPYAAGQRTPLQLTSAQAPALPVYSLEILPDVVALEA
jgi:hypothetical protein